MSFRRKGWTLAALLLALLWITALFPAAVIAQVVTTEVTDTVNRADGRTAGGSVLVSWPAFTTASGQAVASGSTSATLTSGGVLDLRLTPNAGATPIGTYYTAVYHLDDGSVSREYWVIPVSQTPVHISTIRSTILPTSVAMQTVSKSYVDTAIAAAVAGAPLDSSNPYVLRNGDTMTGPLTLAADPVTPSQAATKSYVDANVAGVTSGLSQKVTTFPAAGQTVAQPAGSQLSVNRVNGVQYASQFQTDRGGNGIANALAGPDCAAGCDLKAEQNYDSSEIYYPSQWSNGTHIEDHRGGQRRDSYLNPESVMARGDEAGQVISVTATRNTAEIHQVDQTRTPTSSGLEILHQALTGGSNHFPQNVDLSLPYFKTNYTALAVKGIYNTQGQHVLAPKETNCYGVGDCLIGSQFINAFGGFRDNADEGAHPFDLQIREDSRVFMGSCSSGCTTGSTSLQIAPTANNGTQGDGRYLIDTNPAKVLSAGVLTGAGAAGQNASAVFSGTSFPVSTFFQTATVIRSQADDIAPGNVAVAIATTGLPAGYSADTAAAPASSGVACVADPTAMVNGIEGFETAAYTLVDGTHIQLSLKRAHVAGATIAIGGLCGYGLEQKVDTSSGIRQVFPVIGSYSATGLYYAGGATPFVGVMGQTSAFANVSLTITSAVRSGSTVTLTTAGNLPVDVNGLTMTVAGATDSSYNGSFVVSSTAPNKVTYTQSGPDSSTTGGTLSLLTGTYALYPMAEVLSVMNPSTKTVDGQMTLAANTVAWEPNDSVEQPHYYQEKVGGDLEAISQYVPRPGVYAQAGMQYEGNNGPGLRGWMINNATPPASYYGNGGTHSLPDAALVMAGPWKRTMVADAGEQSVFTIHCNLHGCNRWNSAYNLFELSSSASVDTMSFNPSTSGVALNLRGTSYSFTPQGFTAGTVNATTVNATTLNGAISASQVPVFKASGSAHAPGAVPDPGATPGTTRFLREDGTWAVPAGGVSGSGFSGSTLAPNATADYNFMQGTGTTVVDATGNGNSSTLLAGTHAPAWVPNGLSFTSASPYQGVQLPAVLNNTQTFEFAVYIAPFPASNGLALSNQYPVILTSSLGGNGVNLLYAGSGPGSYTPGIYAGNAPRVTMNQTISGFHVLAFVLGTGSGNLDHVYIDGVEYPYVAQSASFGLQSGGSYFLGGSGISPYAGSGLLGTMYRARFFPTQLTPAQIQSDSLALTREVAARGVAVDPQPVLSSTPVMHIVGDSIACSWNGSQCSDSYSWSSQLTLLNQPTYTRTNWGIYGATIRGMEASEANRVARRCTTDAGQAVALLDAGVNDLLNGTPSQTFQYLTGEIQTLKRAGCRVFVGTMISSGGNSTAAGAPSMDAQKNAYNALILQQARSAGADGILDFAANPLLGADGANTSANFLADHVHPSAAGQQLMAAAASNALNYYFGYNEVNPHRVTALPYSMTAADGAVSLNGVTGAGNITLPDCTGQSGAVYRINNPQSAYAITVSPLNANQLINGIAFGTPVSVPANGSLVLRDVPNPKTVSGCHWEM
jgi:lysophospholipase L1-like esterase